MEGDDKSIPVPDSDETPRRRQFRSMGLMLVDYIVKKRKPIFIIVTLGILTAFILSYIILF